MLISLWLATAQAHSGGLDKNGCHAGSKPYHCHGASQVRVGRTTSTHQRVAPKPKPLLLPMPKPTAQTAIAVNPETKAEHLTDTGCTYIASEGDSPYQVALHHGMLPETFLKVNGLESNAALKAGTPLYVAHCTAELAQEHGDPIETEPPLQFSVKSHPNVIIAYPKPHSNMAPLHGATLTINGEFERKDCDVGNSTPFALSSFRNTTGRSFAGEVQTVSVTVGHHRFDYAMEQTP